jgi:hypothetical protein
MIPFTADPRIAQAQAQRREMMAQALTPYQMPANPYGGSPVAGNLQRLASALGARWAGQDAAGIQEKQRAAQAEIYRSLSQAGLARPGQLSQRQVPLPGPDYAMTRTEYSIGDDGAQIPTIDPTVMKAAGIEPAAYQVALVSAKAQGDKLTQERLERDINRELSSVLSQENPDMNLARQLQALVDPSKALASKEKRLAAGEKTSPPKQWEANLESLVAGGLSRQRAEDIVHGRIKIVVDNLGNKIIVNLRDETSINIDDLPESVRSLVTKIAEGEPEASGSTKTLTNSKWWEREIGRHSEKRYRGQSLFGKVRGRNSPITGAYPALKGILESTLGQVGFMSGWFQSNEAAQTRQDLQTQNQILIKSLQTNPKFPEGERQAIAKEVQMTPSVLESHGTLTNKMISIAKSLTTRMRKYQEDADDYDLPREKRNAARIAAKDLENYLLILGVPGFGGFEPIVSPESATAEQLKKLSDDEVRKALLR